MKPLHVSEPASQELAEAVGWHENRRPGWGGRFFDEVVRTFGLIEAYPEIGSPRRGRWPSRQLMVRGFAYIVAYRIRADDMYVVVCRRCRSHQPAPRVLATSIMILSANRPAFQPRRLQIALAAVGCKRLLASGVAASAGEADGDSKRKAVGGSGLGCATGVS